MCQYIDDTWRQYIVNIAVIVAFAVMVIQHIIIRHLSLSPSFKIPVRAVGMFKMMITFGKSIWIYADVDFLGKINDALTSPDQIGMLRWNEIMTKVLKQLRAEDLFLVYGGDEFGVRLKFGDTRWNRKRTDANVFCQRFQQLLRDFEYSDWEKENLIKLTGKPCAELTMAWVVSSGWRDHLRAFTAAHQMVLAAKPKDGIGNRGKILCQTTEVMEVQTLQTLSK